MVSGGILKAGFVALALSGAAWASSLPAQAGESTGTWRNGMVNGPYGPGYYGPDGAYYGDGRRQRRRAYVQEYYRPSRNYGTYEQYEGSYSPPRDYRWRRHYEYRRDPYWDENDNW
jgi:hypothetical protein